MQIKYYRDCSECKHLLVEHYPRFSEYKCTYKSERGKRIAFNFLDTPRWCPLIYINPENDIYVNALNDVEPECDEEDFEEDEEDLIDEEV